MFKQLSVLFAITCCMFILECYGEEQKKSININNNSSEQPSTTEVDKEIGDFLEIVPPPPRQDFDVAPDGGETAIRLYNKINNNPEKYFDALVKRIVLDAVRLEDDYAIRQNKRDITLGRGAQRLLFEALWSYAKNKPEQYAKKVHEITYDAYKNRADLFKLKEKDLCQKEDELKNASNLTPIAKTDVRNQIELLKSLVLTARSERNYFLPMLGWFGSDELIDYYLANFSREDSYYILSYLRIIGERKPEHRIKIMEKLEEINQSGTLDKLDSSNITDTINYLKRLADKEKNPEDVQPPKDK